MNLKDTGHTAFNALAVSRSARRPPEPGRDRARRPRVVEPRVPEASFPAAPVQITAGRRLHPTQASDLAKLINYGALPVQLKQLTSQSVSPSLGKDQLNAGIAAGMIGLVLVALYMLVYYRMLGAVVIAGLMVSAALHVLPDLVPRASKGLTLTLAGVTGLIVSVGITVDSYVVYFERLKDEVRTGKTVRSSVDRGFTRSFRTIVAADLVSLIGAGASLLPRHRVGARLRVVPRHLDDPRPPGRVLLHAPARVDHGAPPEPRADAGVGSPPASTRRGRRRERHAAARHARGSAAEWRRDTLRDIYHERTHFEFIEPLVALGAPLGDARS